MFVQNYVTQSTRSKSNRAICAFVCVRDRSGTLRRYRECSVFMSCAAQSAHLRKMSNTFDFPFFPDK